LDAVKAIIAATPTISADGAQFFVIVINIPMQPFCAIRGGNDLGRGVHHAKGEGLTDLIDSLRHAFGTMPVIDALLAGTK